MSRAPSPDQRLAYEREKAFLLALLDLYDTPPHPATTLVGEGRPDGTVQYREVPNPPLRMRASVAEALEQFETRSFTHARRSLKLGVQDALEMSRDFPAAWVTALDGALAQAGLETLTAARSRVWRTIPKLLNRGRNRTEAEYYLLIERLNDTADDSLTAADRARLGAMVAAFEPAKGTSGEGAV